MLYKEFFYKKITSSLRNFSLFVEERKKRKASYFNLYTYTHFQQKKHTHINTYTLIKY